LGKPDANKDIWGWRGAGKLATFAEGRNAVTDSACPKSPQLLRRAPAAAIAAASGSAPSHPFRIITGVAQDWAKIASGELVLVCPWLSGLDPLVGLWLAALPIHDCNAFVDNDWILDAPPCLREHCYVGVFALDRLRSSQQIFGPLRDKGVSRLINLPSISFFDGATAQTFARLAFTLESEIAFLAQARGAGFGTALCARSEVVLAPEKSAPFDFILRHQVPGQPLTIDPI
jgi:predicted TIM-barrel enzyme